VEVLKALKVTQEMKRLCRTAECVRLRKGVGIVECLILIVILVLTFEAINTTLSWSSKSYTLQEIKGRELLFNWSQAFESLWSASDYPQPEDAFEKVADMLNGSWDAADVHIGGFTIVARAGIPTAGKLPVELKIYAGDTATGKPVVKANKSFNIFPRKTVSGDYPRS
jgi:hypothetical protein